KLSAGRGLVDEFRRHRTDEVVLGVEEGEPDRLALVDHVDRDAPGERQALALEVLGNARVALVLAAGGLEILLAEIGVRREHHARRAAPLRELVGARADGML